MDKIHEIAGDGALMPRFDDGMVNMAELIRVMAESLVNEIMDARADEACEGGNRRDGHRERKLVTGVGTINLRIPKLRAGGHFPEDLIERYSRAARTMGIDRMSASQVSRICSSLDESVADLQERDLSDVTHPYIWLDAIDTESHGGWKSFLLSLRARGVDGAICVASDAHEGLKRAIREVFPGAAGQRCIAHLMRSAAGNAPTRQKKGAVPGILKAAFAERDPELVREPCQLATAQIEGFCPKVLMFTKKWSEWSPLLEHRGH